MSLRSFRERPQSGTFTFHSEDAHTEPSSLDDHMYEAVPLRDIEGVPFAISSDITSLQATGHTSTTETSKDTCPGNHDILHKRLERSSYQIWFSIPMDILMSLIPLFFMIIASLCLALDGKPTSSYGKNLKAITLLSPTIFPIVYAAILGKLLRRVGLFKAERSATIGTLERFIGCQSLFATLERQFGLRRVDFISVSILLAWLLSPLGGQSSLRLLSTSARMTAHNSTIQYISIEGFWNLTSIQPEMVEISWPRFVPLYLTAFQLTRQTFDEPADLFGNIKIPDITSLHGFESAFFENTTWYNREVGRYYNSRENIEFDQYGKWYDVTSPITYTSLLGIPVVGVPTSANMTFTVVSSYWTVRCDAFTYATNISSERGKDKDNWGLDLSRGVSGPSFDIVQHKSDEAWVSYNQRARVEFDYVSKVSSTDFITAKCAASLQVVESQINCATSRCGVQRMREMKRPNDVSTYLFRILTYWMPGAGVGRGQRIVDTSELVEQWIMSPDLATWMTDKREFVNLSNLSNDTFSERLQMAINTYWDSTIGLRHRMGNLTLDDVSNSNITWSSSPMNATAYEGEQYACNTVFAIITIAVSWFLFMAANVSIVLGIATKAPDILGYVSTCARDNPYFGKHVASHLDGLEAARALRDVRVRIGDVRRQDDVGYIAFASMDAGPCRVDRQRLYS